MTLNGAVAATIAARAPRRLSLLTVAFLIGLVTLPAHAQQGPTQAELNAAASNAVDWLLTNHDYGGQRFVDATEITRDNAASLRAACVYQAADLRPFHTNPLVYRGVMYLTTSQATIALDAATCRVQWRHVWRPKAKENWPQSRGVALKEGIIIRGTSDGYLLALDALTGQLLWERAAADAMKGETFTMPPVVFEDLVIIGPAGNEVPVRGWVGAFRVATGEPVWRFNTRPAAGEPGAETWSMTEALTGGGAVWTPFSLDPAQGLVFVPVGNPAPDFYSDVRQGANLYTNSLVVLDARTGKLVWHYQAVPHDLHDWDLTQVSPLFTAQVNGRERRLVSVVGKDGLLHALDRESREQVYEVAVTRRENVELVFTRASARPLLCGLYADVVIGTRPSSSERLAEIRDRMSRPGTATTASTCLRVLRFFRRGAEGHRQLVTAWVENRILTASLNPDSRCAPFALRYRLPWRHVNHLKRAVCSQSDGSAAPC